MTTKKKIIISVIAACLVVAVAVVGVLAATQQNVGITNTVSFTANAVNARIDLEGSKQAYTTGDYTTTSGDAIAIVATPASLTFDANDAESVNKTATLVDQTSMGKYDIITYTFYIISTGDRTFTASIDHVNEGAAGTNLDVSYAFYCGASKAAATTQCEATGTAITANKTGTTTTLAGFNNTEVAKIVITVKVHDKGLNASGTFNWSIALQGA